MVEVRAEQRHHEQGQPLDETRARTTGRPIRVDGLGVLMIVGNLRADQQRQPVQVQPDHEQEQDGEPRVDRRVARRADGERGEGPGQHLPEHAGHGASDQRRAQPHARVGDEHVDDGERRDHQQVGRDLSGPVGERPERLDREDALDHEVRAYGRHQADGREHEHGPDEQHAQISAHAQSQRPEPADAPRVVEGTLDLLDQREHDVEQQRQAQGAENADLDVLDEADDARGDLLALRPQRREEPREHRLDLVVHPERLQHREADREQRHDRQQRRVDQAHGAQRELTLGEVARHRVEQAQRDDRDPRGRSKALRGNVPHQVTPPLAKTLELLDRRAH